MKKFVFTLVIALCAATMAQAQTFTDHVQKNNTGKGKVVIRQSKEIDELVNSAITSQQNTTTKTTPTTPQTVTKKQEENHTAQTHNADSSKKQVEESLHKSENKLAAAPHEKKGEAKTESPTENTPVTIDTSKKVMRGAQKVKGYRVQVFAGGNTRADKQKATEAGNAVKRKFPDQPVYVHFYSPRWICRVGNFRNYQDAQKILTQVKAMGYKSASIVSGKITVQY